MALNKEFWIFELMVNGWSIGTLTRKDEVAMNKASALTLRLIEYSHDEKSDRWYAAEVVRVNDSLGKDVIEARFARYGFPKLIERECEFRLGQLRQELEQKLAA